MIQLSRNYSLPERDEEIIPIKVIGIGGAGSNALDRIVLDGVDKADLIAANTDVQSLASSVAANKVQLGRSVSRGLGAGGDPELGHAAATEAIDEIRTTLGEARMVFICAGLGGGTGSGAAPVIAEVARDSGALVISLATMPFTFEGKRRMAQAREALARLQQVSDAVVCFENDIMGDIVAPKAGIHQAFAAADVTISQSVRAIVSLMQRPGLIRIGFDDLLSALRSGPDGRCLFGYGESDSDNRAHDALTLALKNPLMDRGRLLADAANVLVQIAGGPGMTLAEVEAVMHDLSRHIDDRTQILFGTSVDGRMGNRLAVTLISALAGEGETVQPPLFNAPATRPATPPSAPASAHPKVEPQMPAAQTVNVESDDQRSAPLPLERPLRTIDAVISAPEPAPPAVAPEVDEPLEPELIAPAATSLPEEIITPEPQQPRVLLPKKKPNLFKEVKPPIEKAAQAKQEVLQFESVTRGRFEKSEPTIVEGQDLDVPTFLRKNVRVK
ncbi:MAG: cell division protein FtsZ [Verrucomicrobiota bacterium]|nr:cell division protein FtsZ [Verrucomicrobiota bacterium]